MAEQYLHTLIPGDPRYVPTPENIVHFLEGLSSLGAAPLNSKLILLKPSGRVREFRNPLTGEVRSMPVNERLTLEKPDDLASQLQSLDQYIVAVDGQGPPTVPAFPLYFEDAQFTKTYGYIVRCCLKAEPVSMSCLGDEKTDKEVPFFGEPCVRKDASFRRPETGEMIEVGNAGCARFWVEFEFGRWLWPSISNSLNILDSSIAEMANEAFSVRFAQGFHTF